MNAGAGRILLTNVGAMVTGRNDETEPVQGPISIEMDQGIIVDVRVGDEAKTADPAAEVVDAFGMTVVPALVDAHSHPVIAGYNPKQGLYDFVSFYVLGGVGGFVSAGPVHFPGMHGASADFALSISRVVTESYAAEQKPGRARIDAGCILATPDMEPRHIEAAHGFGIRRLKFLYEVDKVRRRDLTSAAKALGWNVLLHCGGTSVPGSSGLSVEEIVDFGPTVLAHLNGGPTALSDDSIAALVTETDMMIDVVKCGNPAKAVWLAEWVAEHEAWDRVILGTDSPTGSGMVPTGLWFLMGLLSSVGGADPVNLIRAASTRPAMLYWDEDRSISPGNPASLLVVDAPMGGTGGSAVGSIRNGDIPGLAAMFLDGHLVKAGFTTPPSGRAVQVHK